MWRALGLSLPLNSDFKPLGGGPSRNTPSHGLSSKMKDVGLMPVTDGAAECSERAFFGTVHAYAGLVLGSKFDLLTSAFRCPAT